MKDYNEIMNGLQGRFRQCPETPESLSKENIMKRIKQENTVQEKKRSFAFGAEAVAAVFAVIIVIAVVLGKQGFFRLPNEVQNDVNIITQSATFENAEQKNEDDLFLPEGVYKFESTEEIQKRFKKLYKDKNGKGFFSYVFNYAEDVAIGADGVKAENAVVATTVAAAMNAPTGTANNSSEFGTTNVQTVGVDEGDILKNDGRYIYIASSYGSDTAKVKIVDTETMEHISTVDIGSKTEVHIEEIYVTGDILTVIYIADTDNSDYYGSGDETRADIYDISDRATPKKVNSHSQNGGFRNSRKIGNVLYTISCYSVVAESEKQAGERAVPSVNGEKISCDCIYHFEDDSTTYTVITALDTTKTDKATSVAVLGNTREIYCSDSTIYLLNTVYEEKTEKTNITSFSLNGTEILCKAKGKVNGYFKDNYSFDEYEG
ncbi:MAG: beta-propeller domain-containing protein, partial [Acutalibacteraceae bacterium]|nr:beta-propeller domain-containing protein [Acutalibacteraceae bacterium]